MLEVFLYRCQICKLAVIADSDKGGIWYIESCAGCKIGQFYEKINVRVLGVGRNSHYGFVIMEEKKDEEQVD